MPRQPSRRWAGFGRGGIVGCGSCEVSLAHSIETRRHDSRDRQHPLKPGSFEVRSVARPRDGGADPGNRSCIASWKLADDTRRAMPLAACRRLCAKLCLRQASLDVAPAEQRPLSMSQGRVQARIGQTCVVSLDPIESDIDEPIDLIFAYPLNKSPNWRRSIDEAERERRRKFRTRRRPIETWRHRSWPGRDRCVVSWRSIPIRAGRTRFSIRRWSRRPIPKITRLPRSKRCSSVQNQKHRQEVSPQAQSDRPDLRRSHGHIATKIAAFVRCEKPQFNLFELSGFKFFSIPIPSCCGSALPNLGEVKRLCRDGDTLLSRPGGGRCVAHLPSTAAAVAFQCAAGLDEGRKRSGFRDVHASKGSNRA